MHKVIYDLVMLGIDSEVYLLFRVREEYAKLHDFREALVQGYGVIVKCCGLGGHDQAATLDWFVVE